MASLTKNTNNPGEIIRLYSSGLSSFKKKKKKLSSNFGIFGAII